jgi:multidrug efflux system outer membrane protein
VPSALLQRRPDIAAAERRAAAANAQIGVAQAVRFPALTLGGSAGWQSAGGVDLLSSPNAFWMIAPQLAGSIFDGGRRKVGVEVARAQFDQAAASYRGVVLAAFRNVEDQLALANHLADEAKDQDDAVEAAKRTEALAMIRYRQGAANYLEVVTAQTAALQAERAALVLNARRLQASVDLTRALGGGGG